MHLMVLLPLHCPATPCTVGMHGQREFSWNFLWRPMHGWLPIRDDRRASHVFTVPAHLCPASFQTGLSHCMANGDHARWTFQATSGSPAPYPARAWHLNIDHQHADLVLRVAKVAEEGADPQTEHLPQLHSEWGPPLRTAACRHRKSQHTGQQADAHQGIIRTVWVMTHEGETDPVPLALCQICFSPLQILSKFRGTPS